MADGVVDFNEFKQVWYRKVLTNNDAYIHRVFDVFDDNGDGLIDRDELAQILFPTEFEQMHAGAGGTVDDEEAKINDEQGGGGYEDDDFSFLECVKRMISEVDVNGDKRIDFEEFKMAMKEDLEGGSALQQLTSFEGGLYDEKNGIVS